MKEKLNEEILREYLQRDRIMIISSIQEDIVRAMRSMGRGDEHSFSIASKSLVNLCEHLRDYKINE